MLEEYVAKKRKAHFSDVGILTFPYLFQASKRNQVERIFEVPLRTVEVSETRRLLLKLDRLEKNFEILAKQYEDKSKQQ